MSALRAINLPTQVLEPTAAAETEAYPHALATRGVPDWAVTVEELIRVTARFGFSPTPTILLVSGLIIGIALDHG